MIPSHDAIEAARKAYSGPLVRGHLAAFLPASCLTTDFSQWVSPGPDELKTVVGRTSLTGVTGIRAAALCGVSPQSFRKYLTPLENKSSSRISFAAWHLLLHRLDVKRLEFNA